MNGLADTIRGTCTPEGVPNTPPISGDITHKKTALTAVYATKRGRPSPHTVFFRCKASISASGCLRNHFKSLYSSCVGTSSGSVVEPFFQPFYSSRRARHTTIDDRSQNTPNMMPVLDQTSFRLAAKQPDCHRVRHADRLPFVVQPAFFHEPVQLTLRETFPVSVVSRSVAHFFSSSLFLYKTYISFKVIS